jgi:hypothetical protein
MSWDQVLYVSVKQVAAKPCKQSRTTYFVSWLLLRLAGKKIYCLRETSGNHLVQGRDFMGGGGRSEICHFSCSINGSVRAAARGRGLLCLL